MNPSVGSDISPAEVFKALGDPIRWSIVEQLAAVDELACGSLEETLPISKPTISYHIKILTQAGLISVRKQGRNFYYTLRREVLRGLMDDLWTLTPTPHPVMPARADGPPGAGRRGSNATARLRAILGDESNPSEPAMLTW